jgi:hypothetical protein
MARERDRLRNEARGFAGGSGGAERPRCCRRVENLSTVHEERGDNTMAKKAAKGKKKGGKKR